MLEHDAATLRWIVAGSPAVRKHADIHEQVYRWGTKRTLLIRRHRLAKIQ
jgi:hypothetical protein